VSAAGAAAAAAGPPLAFEATAAPAIPSVDVGGGGADVADGREGGDGLLGRGRPAGGTRARTTSEDTAAQRAVRFDPDGQRGRRTARARSASESTAVLRAQRLDTNVLRGNGRPAGTRTASAAGGQRGHGCSAAGAVGRGRPAETQPPSGWSARIRKASGDTAGQPRRGRDYTYGHLERGNSAGEASVRAASGDTGAQRAVRSGTGGQRGPQRPASAYTGSEALRSERRDATPSPNGSGDNYPARIRTAGGSDGQRRDGRAAVRGPGHRRTAWSRPPSWTRAGARRASEDTATLRAESLGTSGQRGHGRSAGGVLRHRRPARAASHGPAGLRRRGLGDTGGQRGHGLRRDCRIASTRPRGSGRPARAMGCGRSGRWRLHHADRRKPDHQDGWRRHSPSERR
jgi:hypothetical protein